MPVVKYFTVTQTRTVVICADSASDAVHVAALAFDDKHNKHPWQVSDVDGYPATMVRETQLTVSDYKQLEI